MRYRKGTIALSDIRDYPLLRRVLHSGFITSDQLYEFMQLEYRASSRNAFDNRLRRLLAHELLLRREIPTINRGIFHLARWRFVDERNRVNRLAATSSTPWN